MSEEYTKLPFIGKKRARKLEEAGIGIEEIAKMDEDELKKHIPRISRGKLKIIIATARQYAGRMYDIMDALGLDKEQAKKLAYNEYDVQKIARAKKEEIAKILGVSEKEAFDIIFRAALKTGVRKAEVRVKKEQINHNVILSKEGFVNGFGAPKIKEEEKKSFRLIPFIIVILLVVSAAAAVFYMQAPSLRIDGNFGEWQSVGGYPLGDSIYKYRYDSGALYFYIHERGMFSEEESFYVFIDDGRNDGYYVDGIKASYVVEFYGWNGTLKGATLWKHVSGQYLWNFTKSSGLIYSAGDNGVEFMINGIPSDSRVEVMMKSGDILRSPPVYVSSPTAQVVVSTLKDVVNDGDAALEINITSPVKFHLKSLVVYCEGADVDNATVMGSGFSLSTSGQGGIVRFDVDRDIKSEKLLFSANYSGATGSVLSFTVEMSSRDVAFSYLYETSKVYLRAAPSSVIIDGAFGDWKNRTGDILMDASDANIDLVNYSHTPTMDKVYFEVRGEFMGGDDVPIVRKWAPKDSDRDGVPDKYDPYPHDFNNDGTPDKDSNGDVDGDGYIDYPAGNDTWLNTTIPSDFPKPYAGRHVSVYIGPAPPVRPKNGNDTAEIYIGYSNSGAHFDWVPFPVNYKITISGRDGIYNAHMYKYSSGNWLDMGEINSIASGYHAVELSTGLKLQNARMWITVFNWENQYDMPSISKNSRSYSTSNVFYFHADPNGNPNYMDWNLGSSDNSVTLQLALGSQKVYTLWRYENEMTERYNVTSATVSFYLNDASIQGTDYLNISLVSINTSANNAELVAYSNISGTDLSNSVGTKYTTSLNVVGDYIGKGLIMGVYFTFSGDLIGAYYNDYIDISYNNSSPKDSNITITTNSTMLVKNVWTVNDTTRVLQSHFKKGETVGVYANVTDPLGATHIADSTTLDITDALGNTIISGSKMTWDSDGFGWVHFYFSFQLVSNISHPYVFVGKYSILVQASDMEGFAANGNGSFWINSGLKRAASKYLFVPVGESHIWFRHRIVNIGDGDDVYNFRFSAADPPKFDVSIYFDSNDNRLIDSSDVLYAVYNASQGAWTYKKNDTDGNGEPDITVIQGEGPRILIAMNVTLTTTNPSTYSNLTVISFTGNSSYTVNDVAKVREVKIKTLYLYGGGDTYPTINDSLYPLEPNGTADLTIQNTQMWEYWNMTTPFLNDFVLAGDIAVKLYIDNDIRPPTDVTINVTLTLSDGTYVGSATYLVPGRTYQWNTIIIHPVISLIPAGDTISMKWYADNTLTLHFNSTTYPSRIEFNTTSYIYVENVQLYNLTASGPVLQSNYSAGDTMNITAVVREPFGSFDVRNVTANITSPNGTLYSVNLKLTEVHPLIGTLIYNGTFNIPSDALVGTYYVNVTAIEGNGVQNSSYTTFQINCNISISPHTNSSTGTVVWYNHTIWNNGSGYDIINVLVESNQNVNITLYMYQSGSWVVIAYSNTGTGWNSITSGYDRDNDGNPDFLVPNGGSVRIAVKVTTNTNVKTYVNISSAFSTCADNSVDSTTVPEFHYVAIVMAAPLFMVFLRRRRK